MIESDKEKGKLGKGKDPTTMETEEESLKKQYKNLQQEWDFIKLSKSNTLRRSSTDSNMLNRSLKLLDNSPRKLMSSLQHTKSSLDSSARWKVRNNDYAIAETLRERRAAIESGKLKGRRRLFDDDYVEECEVRSVFSYDLDHDNQNVQNEQELTLLNATYSPLSTTSSSSSFICDSCMEKEVVAEEGENKMDTEVAVFKQEENKSNVKSKGNQRIILLLVFVIGIISFALRSFSGYRYKGEAFLVPT